MSLARESFIADVNALAVRAKEAGEPLASVVLFTLHGAMRKDDELPLAELCEDFAKDMQQTIRSQLVS